MLFDEALIYCLCENISDLPKVIESGIEPSDLIDPYNKILDEVIRDGVKISREYIQIKYGLNIPVKIYDSISISDVIKNIVENKKDNILRSGLKEIVAKFGNNQYDVDEISDKLIRLYIDYQKIGRRHNTNSGDVVISEVINRYNRVKSGKYYMKTGFEPIDSVTYGIWEGDLVSIVARPGENKTTFMILLLYRAIKEGKKCLWINTEMTDEIILRRLLSISEGFDRNAFKLGLLDKNEEARLQSKKFNIDLSKLMFARSFNMKLDDLVSFVIANKPDILFVDSAYIIKTNGRDDFYERISRIVDMLKQIAIDFNIAVFFTHQLNRDTAKKRRKSEEEAYSLENIGFTDKVACNTDLVFAVYRTESDKVDNFLTIYPLKVRDADLVEKFKINWDMNSSTFAEVIGISNHTISEDISSSDNKFRLNNIDDIEDIEF